MRCYELDNTVAGSTQTATVSAGSSLTVTANGPIYHNGAIFVYMSAASDASSTSAGTGKTWFKIFQNVPVYNSASRSLTFPSTTDSTITFTIPKDVPSGQYLIRAEQIALHAASAVGGAQFYIGCAQVNVVNGGSGSPGPLVSFPGAYSATDPGIQIDIYNIPANYAGYQAPGPAVWGGGSSGSQPSNTATTTRPTSTTATPTKSSSSSSAPTSSSGSSSGAAHYAQCGGQGWTGATTCQAPYTCTAQNQCETSLMLCMDDTDDIFIRLLAVHVSWDVVGVEHTSIRILYLYFDIFNLLALHRMSIPDYALGRQNIINSDCPRVI
jgi:hypothetical protein